MANSTFPYYPLQDSVVQPEIVAQVLPPTEVNNKNFSDRGDLSLKKLREFSQEISIANEFAYDKGIELQGVFDELNQMTLQTTFPLQRVAYQGAFASNPSASQVLGLSEGDLYFNTTELQMYVYYPNQMGQLRWQKISSFFDSNNPLIITEYLKYSRLNSNIFELPTNQSSVTLNLNEYNYFKLETNVNTTVNFNYMNSEFTPDCLEFFVELKILTGGSISWQSNKVYFSNGNTSIILQEEKRHLLKFKSSRGSDNFLVKVQCENLDLF